jgi:Galactose oxidase, central domain
MKLPRRSIGASILASLLPVLILLIHTATSAAQAPGTFTTTGDMTTARARHTATLLPDGRVLIVGGDRTGTAELYDPVTGSFMQTGNGTTGHGGDAAVLLPDARVLIAGGSKSELYDPATGSFLPTGSMVTNQYGFKAILLESGKVLILSGVGGFTDCCASAANPELYDPSTGRFTLAGAYADAPVFIFPGGYSAGTSGLTEAAVALLSNAKVLILSEPSAQLYDPFTNTFSLTGSMVAVDEGNFWGKPTLIYDRTATLMTDGRVLVAGGEPAYWDTGDFPLSRAELYDASTGTFTAARSLLSARSAHTATLLPDGTILTLGGAASFGVILSSAELYNAPTRDFSSAAGMNVSRRYHQATLLIDGRVLVTGGQTRQQAYPSPVSVHASAELYTPAVLVPVLVVTHLQFDRTSVAPGSSYATTVSGSNLTPDAFFDVRYTAPGSNESNVVLNWQRGLEAGHDVPLGIAAGTWTINGVRAHRMETDHAGSFVPVSAAITVSAQ